MLNDPSCNKKLSLGCPLINGMMKGGLPTRGIIEIAGEAGSGKTQFALQALLWAITPEIHGGSGGAAFYLSTEGDFPSKRWNQLVKSQVKKYPDIAADHFNNFLYFRQVGNVDQLWSLLLTDIKLLLRQKPVKLVVIDSIAAVFRVEFTKEQSFERARMLSQHAHELLKLSDEFKIPIVTVNQVRDYFFDSLHDSSPLMSMQNKFVIPALGLAWANCINTRIILSRTASTYAQEEYNPDCEGEPPKKRQCVSKGTVIRSMVIAWCPYLPNNSCFYIIDTDGIHGIEMDSF